MGNDIGPGDELPDRSEWDGAAYHRRFADLAAAGVYLHGEADCVTRLGPHSVLDAGCGTGRVASELAHRGIAVVGIDRDPSMTATARALTPEVEFITVDVADADLGRTFDLVVMAGNVPLFTPSGTHCALVAGCARHLDTGGRLLAGFQLGRGYTSDAYDVDCRAAGLELVDRWATWDGEQFDSEADYAVSLHRRVD